MILKEYQKRAVKDLLSNTAKILNENRDICQSLVFKAPTWSGKTVMMQEFLKELADADIWDFAVVWISVNDLARQSKKSFEKNLQWSKLFFSELSDIQDKTLRENEVLFINWESLKQKDSKTWEWKVLAMKDNERKENLPYLKYLPTLFLYSYSQVGGPLCCWNFLSGLLSTPIAIFVCGLLIVVLWRET